MGLDFGDTGISAVLLHRPTEQLHPIYWEALGCSQQSMRLPTLTCGVVQSAPADTPQVAQPLLHNFKAQLKLAIPHYSPQSFQDQPVLQWSESQELPLSTLQQTLPQLLATLKRPQTLPFTWESPFAQEAPSPPSHLTVRGGAMGLSAKAFYQVLDQLTGVIVSTPANWSDTYRFNLREAVLASELVPSPDAIYFLEDAIATILSGLKAQPVAAPTPVSGLTPTMATGWRGQTLVISSGASTTELSLVNIPASAQTLTRQDFTLRSLPYAGNAIDQDILCQLIYTQMSGRPGRLNQRASLPTYRAGLLLSEPPSRQQNWGPRQPGATPSNARPNSPEDTAVDLEGLELPLPGEPDLIARCRLQQRLQQSARGQQWLEAARSLKMILQHQERFTLELNPDRIVVLRRQLESLVFVPFIQRLNRELNTLLTQTGVAALAIEQVICTGGTAALPAIARWLRQKLPNATIIQDTYPTHSSLTLTCSRIAYGLAVLPLYPQVLDVTHHQYSDYFLLLELLRACPDRPLSVGEIMTLLEQRGINTESCQFSLLAILEGQLPAGLVPTEADLAWLSSASQHNPDYAALTAEPLFYKDGYQIYRPNSPQIHRLQLYLNRVLASTYQKLEEPLFGTLDLSSMIGE